jgi:branched-subunit amino acid transport protein
MSTWIAVGVSTVIVVVLRAAFVVGFGRLHAPRWFDQVGAYVAPAMTAALLAPHVLAPAGRGGSGAEAVAFAVAIPVALRTRSVAWTLAWGMPAVWIVRALA